MEADGDRGVVSTGESSRGNAAFEEGGQIAARVPLGVDRDHRDDKDQHRNSMPSIKTRRIGKILRNRCQGDCCPLIAAEAPHNAPFTDRFMPLCFLP